MLLPSASSPPSSNAPVVLAEPSAIAAPETAMSSPAVRVPPEARPLAVRTMSRPALPSSMFAPLALVTRMSRAATSVPPLTEAPGLVDCRITSRAASAELTTSAGPSISVPVAVTITLLPSATSP